MGPADVPTIGRELSVDPGRLAGAILAGFFVLAVVVEPALLRWSERHAVRWVAGGALLALSAIALGASLSASAWALLALLALYGPASGLATSAAEGALVEADPTARERTMARVTLAGALGDLVVPGLIAVIGWRASFGVSAALALVLAITVAAARSLGRLEDTRGPDPAVDAEDPEDAEPTPLRAALRHRALVGWTALSALAGLMDEVAAAFAAVHLAARFEGPAPLAIALTSWTVGNLAGLVLLERLLARGLAPLRLLAIAAALALPALGAVIFARELALLCAAVAVFGACAATFHPLVKARCYAALPGEPGVVNALGALFSPLELVVPLGLGAIAELASPAAALTTLGAVPLAVLLVALTRSKIP